MKELTPRTWGQSLDELFRQVNLYFKGWMGYFRLCSSSEAKILQKIDAHLRRRVRCIILRRFKSARFLFRHLVSMGVKVKVAANSAYSKKGPWKRSVSLGMNQAYSKKWFFPKVTSLWSEWLRINQPPTTETASGQFLLDL